MADPLGLIGQSGAGRIQPQPARPGDPKVDPAKSFKDVLMKNIEQVNKLQQDAEMAIEDLEAGRRSDPSQVLMTVKKADTAFQLLQQVRNKLIDAYQEIKETRV